jgi:anti-anti-sigma factor
VSPLEIQVEKREGEHRVKLIGELDIASVPELEAALGAAGQGSGESIVIDLSQLRFMDSTGLRAILRADQRLRAEGEQLIVLRGPAAVHRVFQTTGLEPRLRFQDGTQQGGEGSARTD